MAIIVSKKRKIFGYSRLAMKGQKLKDRNGYEMVRRAGISRATLWEVEKELPRFTCIRRNG